MIPRRNDKSDKKKRPTSGPRKTKGKRSLQTRRKGVGRHLIFLERTEKAEKNRRTTKDRTINGKGAICPKEEGIKHNGQHTGFRTEKGRTSFREKIL